MLKRLKNNKRTDFYLKYNVIWFIFGFVLSIFLFFMLYKGFNLILR
jgi:cytochrome oxidase assembly protein ShyY1